MSEPDHVLVPGEWHLRKVLVRKVLAGYTRHYNGHRPHQAGAAGTSPPRQPGHVVNVTARHRFVGVSGTVSAAFPSVSWAVPVAFSLLHVLSLRGWFQAECPATANEFLRSYCQDLWIKIF
jgi:hypothetical protein